MEAIAEAHPNIALVKYWGKRDGPDNVPATPSLSITLSQLRTRTRVRFDPSASDRVVTLNGKVVRDAKIDACLDRLMARSGRALRGLRVDTDNNFPTAAGLASSASGFAALITAMNEALELQMSDDERSIEARRASASAARSLYGGFVTLSGGDDAATWLARPELDAEAWPLAVVVAICSDQPKAVSSSAGMLQSKSSPFYARWTETAATDFTEARAAVAARDFERLGAIAEANCLAMHAVMLSARPTLSYWTPATVACMSRVRELRDDGERVFLTIDAGPQVKAVCEPTAAERVRSALATVPGVQDVAVVGLGGPAHIVSA
jgi:diphosphomevalonate decarboxylase